MLHVDGRWDDAERLYRESLESSRKVLGARVLLTVIDMVRGGAATRNRAYIAALPGRISNRVHGSGSLTPDVQQF